VPPFRHVGQELHKVRLFRVHELLLRRALVDRLLLDVNFRALVVLLLQRRDIVVTSFNILGQETISSYRMRCQATWDAYPLRFFVPCRLRKREALIQSAKRGDQRQSDADTPHYNEERISIVHGFDNAG
jgi:hypothetical protein